MKKLKVGDVVRYVGNYHHLGGIGIIRNVNLTNSVKTFYTVNWIGIGTYGGYASFQLEKLDADMARILYGDHNGE